MTAPGHQTARQAAHDPDLTQLHAQATAALEDALRMLATTSPTTPNAEVFARALARSMRATSALKQACAAAKRGAA